MSALAPDPPAGGETAARTGFDWRKAALLLVVVAAVVAFFVLGGRRWLSLGALQANRERLLELTRRHYALTIAVAVAVYAAATALGFPGALVLTLAVGFVLGPWVGALVVIAGATAGATAAFLGARYLFADAARRRMGPRLTRLAEGFGADGFSYMLFLRLVPVFPFWLVNLAPAFTPLPTRTYVAGTALGIIPGTLVYCYLGAQLSTLHATSDLFRPRLVVALALLAALSLVPVVWKKVRTRHQPGASK